MNFPAPDLTAPSATQAASTLAVANALAALPATSGAGSTTISYVQNGLTPTSTTKAPSVDAVTLALSAKADLVAGVVPYGELPAGTLLLKSLSGSYAYFATYEMAINAAGEGDTIYFGPGTFGTSAVDVHLMKTISLVLDPGTTWVFNRLYLQTYTFGPRTYTINGQGGGKLVGIIAYNDGSVTASLSLVNLRHEGVVTHSSFLAINGIPSKLKFDQVRSVTATGDYLTIAPRFNNFYYKPLVVESYNSFHSVAAGSFLKNTGSDGVLTDAVDCLIRIHRSTLKCPPGTVVFINADVCFTYDFSLTSYVGVMNAAIVNGTAYSFLGAPTGVFRGPWTASTAYAKYDTVVQGGVSYYANAAFTSGINFVASNWTTQRSLDFRFPPGANLTIAAVATAAEAGTYATAVLKNVASATYYINAAAAPLPLTVADGDAVLVTITLTNSALGAYATLTA